MKAMTRKGKHVKCYPVQLMVFGMTGQDGVAVPKVAGVEQNEDSVTVTHQGMEEMIVVARMTTLHPVTIKVVVDLLMGVRYFSFFF